MLDWLPWRRKPPFRALVLAGGGVIGGMYEVGALAACDELLPGFRCNAFEPLHRLQRGLRGRLPHGPRAPPRDLYQILDEERDDPLDFNRGSVYHKAPSARRRGTSLISSGPWASAP